MEGNEQLNTVKEQGIPADGICVKIQDVLTNEYHTKFGYFLVVNVVWSSAEENKIERRRRFILADDTGHIEAVILLGSEPSDDANNVCYLLQNKETICIKNFIVQEIPSPYLPLIRNQRQQLLLHWTFEDYQYYAGDVKKHFRHLPFQFKELTTLYNCDEALVDIIGNVTKVMPKISIFGRKYEKVRLSSSQSMGFGKEFVKDVCIFGDFMGSFTLGGIYAMLNVSNEKFGVKKSLKTNSSTIVLQITRENMHKLPLSYSYLEVLSAFRNQETTDVTSEPKISAADKREGYTSLSKGSLKKRRCMENIINTIDSQNESYRCHLKKHSYSGNQDDSHSIIAAKKRTLAEVTGWYESINDQSPRKSIVNVNDRSSQIAENDNVKSSQLLENARMDESENNGKQGELIATTLAARSGKKIWKLRLEDQDIVNNVLPKVQSDLVSRMKNGETNTAIVLKLRALTYFDHGEIDPVLKNIHWSTQQTRMNNLFELMQNLAIFDRLYAYRESDKITRCLEQLCNLEGQPNASERFRKVFDDHFPGSLKEEYL